MKLNLPISGRIFVACFATALSLATASAQTTANFINPAGGEWNVPGNWDLGQAPGNATNAVISTNAVGVGSLTVTYDVPMAAANFQTLTNKSAVLAINNSGFNVVGGGGNAVVLYGTAKLFINNGGAMSITGGMNITTNSAAALMPGGTLSVSGTMAVSLGGNSSSGGAPGSFTNYGGNMTIGTVTINNGSGNQNGFCFINGGTNSIGTVTIGRSALSGSFGADGVEGMLISNGIVTIGAINIGGAATLPANSFCTFQVSGGIVTNTGNIRIHQLTSARQSRFYQTGGRYVLLDPSVVTNDSSASGAISTYSVVGGTNVAAGFSWGWLSNGIAQLGTVNFTNQGNIFVGSAGIISNGAVVLNCALNNGGRFGAYADWTNFATLTINGGTFDCEDVDGTPHNIYSAGTLRGGGTFTKTGPGTLTLMGPNTFTGNMIVNSTVVLANDGVTTFGSLATASISVGSGATLDVSQVAGGFTLGTAKTIGGIGTVVGSFGAGAGSFISPAGAGAQGTLNFANGLGATNATFNFELTDNPSGLLKVNDAVNITGDFTVSGVDTINVTPLGSLGIGTYKLIKYTGGLNGTLANLSVPPSVGTLSNGVGEIDLIVTQVRPVANLLWRGDGVANVWDTGASSNWLNGASLDRFYTGDTNVFDDSATNFTVFESGALFPASAASILVKGTNNYTFTGDGGIDGATGLIKTNSGILTILSTNGYTGVTTISGGGTVAVMTLSDGGVSGPLGAGTSATNLVMDNGNLRYDGPTLTAARGFTVGPNGGTINITSGATLTISNNVTGPGVLTKAGNGELSLTVLSDYAGGTVVQGGILRPTQGQNATINSLGTNTVTLVGTTTNGPVTFWFGGNGETLVNTLNIVSTNDVLCAGNNTISGLTGNGYLRLNGAGDTFSLRAIDGSAYAGTLFASTIANLRFFPSSGTVANYANTIIDLGTNIVLFNDREGITVPIGALFGSPQSLMQGSSSADAPSTYIIGSLNMDMIFSGTINEVSANRKVNLTKTGTGTLTLNGGTNTTTDLMTFQDVTVYTNLVQYTGSTVISNGVLALVAPASLTNSATVTLATSTAVLDESQEGDPDITGENIINTGVFEAVAGHSINGLGTIRGGLVVDSGGRLNVGLPGTTGVLTVTNAVTLNGTTSMKLIKGNTPSSDNVTSTTAGLITYGGALVVTNGGGALAVNDTFTLFSAPTLSGSFTSTNLPFGYAWDTSQLGVSGTIKVTAILAVVAPQFSNVDFSRVSSGLITFNGTGSAGGPVSLRTSPDVLTPLASWSVIASGAFDGSGNYSTNLAVNPAAPKQFYILTSP